MRLPTPRRRDRDAPPAGAARRSSRRPSSLLLAVAAALAAGAPPPAAAAGQAAAPPGADTAAGLAFVDVTVIPMDRERVLLGRTVLVSGGRIVAVGARDSVAVPEGWTRVEGGDGRFLLPGLVDMHTHLRYDADLVLYLARGVTTVRNMNGGPRHLEWRRAVRGGAFGPDVLTAGPTFFGKGPATPAAADSAVAAQKAAGYDFVKVYDFLSADAYRWIADAARRHGMPVVGHIPAAVGVDGAVAAGQRSVEHAEQFVYHAFGADLDRTRIPALARRLAEAGVAVTPVMELIRSFVLAADDHAALLSRPETRYLHPETLAWWHTIRRRSSFENRMIDDFQEALVRAFAEAGVPLLVGTDVYGVGLVGGWALLREMRRMREAGLSAWEVLRAATRTPAEVLGRDDAGTVAVGRRADLLLVDGDPLRELEALERIVGVARGGAWHPADSLRRRLEAVAAAYAPGQRLVADALAGRAARAIAAYRAALGGAVRSRGDAELVAYVARILRERGRELDAARLYRLVLEIEPGNDAARKALTELPVSAGGAAP